jgi:hypothetical protein
MNKPLLNLKLLNDKNIFEAIHETKGQFKALFADISNGLENRILTDIYASSKGVKISMGNELQKCPYQVLDIFRDFDKKTGHNIRILNWWGHGLYIFVFFGKELAIETLNDQNYFQKLDFRLANGSSPWDYSNILKLPLNTKSIAYKDIETHLLKYGYLNWYKEIKLNADMDKLRLEISDQLDQIFHFHRI